MIKAIKTTIPFILFGMMIMTGLYITYTSYKEEINNVFVENFGYLIPDFGQVEWTDEYKTLNNTIDEQYFTTKTMLDDKTIYDEYNLPNNEASTRYVNSYLNRIILIDETLDKVVEKNDMNQAMKDIDFLSSELNSLNTTFLAGADFEPVEMTDKNGQTFTDNGVNGNNMKELDDETLQQESIARTIQPLGQEYTDEVEELSETFDMDVVVGFENLPTFCQNNEHDYSSTIALICTADPKIIYVNDNHINGDVRDYPNYVDFVKHEIAHKLIHDICGTTSPDIAGDRYEAVTSSYAVKYLGADYERLQKASENFDIYTMDSNSENIAQEIHDSGKCI